jgi:hypothetical protein
MFVLVSKKKVSILTTETSDLISSSGLHLTLQYPKIPMASNFKIYGRSLWKIICYSATNTLSNVSVIIVHEKQQKYILMWLLLLAYACLHFLLYLSFLLGIMMDKVMAIQ